MKIARMVAAFSSVIVTCSLCVAAWSRAADQPAEEASTEWEQAARQFLDAP